MSLKKTRGLLCPLHLAISVAKIGKFLICNNSLIYFPTNYIFVNVTCRYSLPTFGFMIFRVILIAIILILISRFVLRFLFPVFQITRMTQSKLREMQEQMENMQRQEQAKPQPNNRVKEGDYIDYEEVK